MGLLWMNFKKLIKGGFPILAFLILTINAQAQSALTLQVLDEELQPVHRAFVQYQLDQVREGQSTDTLGMVKLPGEAPILVEISHPGYVTRKVTVFPGDIQRVILATLITNLSAVEVEGFLEERSLREQAGGISRLGPQAFSRYGEQSLVQAINSIPGIRFEERAGASYRISIRGSSIRSPFRVRNVKVYWNGLPFTVPGGNTFINLLDMANVSNAEVIKGPAASIYGAGTGGVIKLTSTNLSTLANATAVGASFGSFGSRRLQAAHNFLGEKSSLTFKWANQVSDGYREHNKLDRTVFEFDGLFFPDERRTISASFLYSDLDYEIPGGLNPDQRAENPRQSRPNSIERNSSVANELYLVKLGHEYEFRSGLVNKTNLSGSFNQFVNPFILDFKQDNQQVFSLRTEFSKDLKLGAFDGKFSYGLETQDSFFDGKNFGNVAGQADTIRFADEVRSQQDIAFLNFQAGLGNGFSLTAGLSRTKLSYNIDRTIDRINNAPQEFLKSFEAEWSQRVAVSKLLGDDLAIHFSISNGFSPPTTTEVRTNEGSINQALQAEQGVNYELNFRGTTLKKKLSFDLALFHFRLDETITTFTNQDGVVLFRNAGETRQNGLELGLQANWIEDKAGFVSNFRSGLAYTYHDFSFENYIDDGDDFSGNDLPGTAPHVLNLRSDLEFNNGTYINLTWHYSDPIPLNDANTFFSRAYNLVNLRTGFKGKLSQRTNFELFFGVDNLFDVSYSLGNDLNAFGRRYFQPAPSINYYAGLKLKLAH